MIASTRTQVFVSYSHEDAEWLKRLQVHLKPLMRSGDVDLWDDTRIKPGAKWRKEIEQALASAKVAVLLISADFLASDFIDKDELPPLLAAAEQDEAVILSLIVSPSLYEETPSLARFQAANSPKKPLTTLDKAEQEKVLVQVAKAIKEALSP
jgi:hypothetical protein